MAPPARVIAGPTVAVVATGTANTASVLAAFRRLGARPFLTHDPGEVERAERLVLPGVGAFAAAMDELERRGLADVLTRRLTSGRATLAICLGLQLLLDGSDESPERPGLGVVAGRAEPFAPAPGLRVPQLGWNAVVPDGGQLMTPGQAYFANTYRLGSRPPAGWSGATTDHGGPFTSALERGGVLACQFHPELSGAWGMDLLGRWLRLAPFLSPPSCPETQEVR